MQEFLKEIFKKSEDFSTDLTKIKREKRLHLIILYIEDGLSPDPSPIGKGNWSFRSLAEKEGRILNYYP